MQRSHHRLSIKDRNDNNNTLVRFDQFIESSADQSVGKAGCIALKQPQSLVHVVS